MNLSIFNFKKAYSFVIIFFVLFSFYNIYLITQKPNIIMFQNQWQNNYSFAQEFIYENKAKNIIVGSSMAARMQNKFFSKDFYNLSFSGGSVLTGLEIIKKSGFVPKNIYIENNEIFRKKDDYMLDSLFYPIWWKAKEYIPGLKEKYQPLNIIASKLRGSYGKSHEELMKERRNNKIFTMTVKRHKTNYNKKLKNYDKKLYDLKSLIKYFEDRGSHIVFFEMPIYDELANSIKANEQREVIKNSFANKWVKLPDNKYITTDGIHLIYKSAFMYSDVFLKEINDR